MGYPDILLKGAGSFEATFDEADQRAIMSMVYPHLVKRLLSDPEALRKLAAALRPHMKEARRAERREREGR